MAVDEESPDNCEGLDGLSDEANDEIVMENVNQEGTVRVFVTFNRDLQISEDEQNSSRGSQDDFGPDQSADSSQDSSSEIPVFSENVRHQFDGYVSMILSEEEYQQLKSNPQVESIEPVGIKRITLSESVELVNGLRTHNTQLNSFNLTGKGETVCVIDTGVNFSIAALSGKNVTSHINCVNSSNGTCVEDASFTPSGLRSYHGSYVSLIIAGNGSNGSLKGVAPDANIISVVAINGSSGFGYDDDVLAGVSWCINNSETYNISVISMSLSGGRFDSYCDDDYFEKHYSDMTSKATEKNISVVAATGNGGSYSRIGSPACIRDVISVAGTYDENIYYRNFYGGILVPTFSAKCVDVGLHQDKIVCNSDRNNVTDLVAPSNLITLPYGPGSSIVATSGTSMAAPHVSGAIALISQLKRLENKTISPSEILDALKKTGKKINDSGFSNLNFSRVDVYSAITSLNSTPLSTPPPPPNKSFQNASFSFTPVGSIVDNFSLIMEEPRGVFLDGDLAYVASKKGLQILNVSDPLNIDVLGNIFDDGDLLLRTSRDVFVRDGLAYVASHLDDGVQILNVSDPNRIIALGSIANNDSLVLNSLTSIFVEGDLAYVTSFRGVRKGAGLQILNVSDPNNIVPLGNVLDNESLILDGAYDVQVENGLAYIVSRYDTGLQILNVSDPNNIVPLDGISDNDSLKLSNSRGLHVENGLAYVASFKDGVQILNVSDPNNIVPLGSIEDNDSLSLGGSFSIQVLGDLAYVASYSDSGVQILNVSDPNNIVPLGKITKGGSLKLRLGGAIYILVKNGLAYVPSYKSNGIQILNVSNPQAISPLGSIGEPLSNLHIKNGVTKTHLKDDLLYVGSFAGLRVFNVSNPENVVFLGGIRDHDDLLLKESFSIFVKGDLAYSSSDTYPEQGIQVLNVSDPQNITPLAKIEQRYQDPLHIRFKNDLAYVIYQTSIKVFNASDPANINFGSSIHTYYSGDGTFGNVFVKESILYIVTSFGPSSIKVFNLSGHPDYVTLLGDIDDNDSLVLDGAYGIQVDDGLAYVASYLDAGVQILNVSDPGSIAPLGSVSSSPENDLVLEGARAVFLRGRYLFVASYDGIQVLDVSNPRRIVPVGKISDDDSLMLKDLRDIFVKDDYVFVASYVDEGVQILRLIDHCSGVSCGGCEYCSGGQCVSSCTSGETCSSGMCVAPDPCSGVSCGGCEYCSGGQCVSSCTSGETCSSGQCVVVDPCSGVSCGGCEYCSGGQCVSSCSIGETCSSGVCTPVDSCTGVSCGGCDYCSGGQCVSSCTSGETCSSGQCVVVDPCSGVSCGGCEYCSGGQCVSSCTSGETCSSGQCVVVDPCSGVSCGGCEYCSGGQCVSSCSIGETCSSGQCVVVDPCSGVSCGGCEYCSGGQCVSSCSIGETCSSGQCVVVDPCSGVSCGGCEYCSGGQCVSSCSIGETCSSGQCVVVDPCSGVSCGGCEYCSGGQCVSSCSIGETCSSGVCGNPSENNDSRDNSNRRRKPRSGGSGGGGFGTVPQEPLDTQEVNESHGIKILEDQMQEDVKDPEPNQLIPETKNESTQQGDAELRTQVTKQIPSSKQNGFMQSVSYSLYEHALSITIALLVATLILRPLILRKVRRKSHTPPPPPSNSHEKH